MPITINENKKVNGFCHEVTITITKERQPLPASFILGNYGDNNITQLKFDISDLDIPKVNENNYNYYLVVKGEENKKIELVDNAVVISSEMLQQSECAFLYVIEEKHDDQELDNTSHLERFVSDEFRGQVLSTDYNILSASSVEELEDEDVESSFSKNNIIINLSNDHYTISCNNDSLGNKFDSYIKRISLNENDNPLDEGLINRYCIIIDNNGAHKIKMSFDKKRQNVCSCLIPGNITNAFQSSVIVFFIAESDDKYRRWVSPSILMNVQDNFLTSVPISDLSSYVENAILTNDDYALLDKYGQLLLANGVI